MTDRFTAAQDVKTSEPLPLDEEFTGAALAQRIWIGNMDTKITEYTMLQVLKDFGKIKQFDFLVHKSGPQQGEPRGYCFVSFEKEVDAARAILKLNNMLVLTKRLQVRWANCQKQTKPDPKETLKLPVDSAVGEKEMQRGRVVSTDAKIRAIEAKLRQMEKTKDIPTVTGESSSAGRLHPLLALSKQNAAAKEASKPYYKKRRHRR